MCLLQEIPVLSQSNHFEFCKENNWWENCQYFVKIFIKERIVLFKKLKNINFDGFDGLKASNIMWQIGAIKGKSYENGLPHTRKYIIVLPIEKTIRIRSGETGKDAIG